MSNEKHIKNWYQSKLFEFDSENQQDTIYSIDTPPPTISGKLHIGHIFSYSHCDFIARFKRTMGNNVFYPIGFDNNGLPTERMVEKIHNISAIKMFKNNEQDKFIDMHTEVIKNSQKEFENLFKNMGYSFDWTKQYSTISKHCKKIAQASFADLFYKGLIYISKAPIYWDTVDQTAQAQADLEEKNTQSKANNISFTIHQSNEEIEKCLINPSFLNNDIETKIIESVAIDTVEIMTTRPELLPSCLCILYHPEDKRYNGEGQNKSFKITRVDGSEIQIKGIDFKNKYAKTPFGLPIPILSHKEVQKEKGTGIVMCCSFGDWQDVNWIHDLNLREPNIIITDNGKIHNKVYQQVQSLSFAFNSNIPISEYNSENSRNIISSREEVIKILSEKEFNFNGKQNKYLTCSVAIEHNVKCAERSGKPVEILHKPQYYINFGFRNAQEKLKTNCITYINTIKENNIEEQSKKETDMQSKDASNLNKFQQEILKMTKQIKFHPENTKIKLTQWIEGLNQDWCISRNRFAGIKIPSISLYITEDKTQFAILPNTSEKEFSDEYLRIIKNKTNNQKIIKAIDIIKQEASEQKITTEQYIKESIESKNSNGEWIRNINTQLKSITTIQDIIELEENSESLVFDTWFTSSISPQINTGIIESDKHISEIFEMQNKHLHNQIYPMSLRPQAHEIIRTWAFYTISKAYLHSIIWNPASSSFELNQKIEKTIPWENVLLSGWCLAEDKSKMSKSKGNIVEPMPLVELYGADPIRYWAASTSLGSDTAYSEATIKEGIRLIKKLENTTKFYEMHKKHLQHNHSTLQEDLKTLISESTDKWIIAHLKEVIIKYIEYFENYEYSKAKEVIETFFWKQICDNYLEIIKGRIYGTDSFVYKSDLYKNISDDIKLKKQISAIHTLKHLLHKMIILFSPFIPFTTETLNSNFVEYNEENLEELHKHSIHRIGSMKDIQNFQIPHQYQLEGDEIIKIIEDIRKYKSEQQLSIKAPIVELTIKQEIPEEYEFDFRAVCNALEAKITINQKIEETKISH